ncbi:cytosolic purine 5'-nucleotidase-like [Populus alba x Populus x berolinensis]|nr:cytosolic purine 5'-nucleotidase-like [Populus alba x Populus x berolinensis]
MSVTAEVLAKFWLAQQRDTRCGAPLSNSPLFVRPMFANTTKRARMMVVCRCSVGDQIFSVTPSTNYEFDYLGQSTKGDLHLNFDHLDTFGMDGPATLQGPIEEVAMKEAEEAEDLLNDLGISSPSSARNSSRGIFCSRTLNLRSISAIGYDMDYTLIHYNVKAWEGRAYDYCLGNLRSMGFPVDGLAFDPDLVIRGLVIDKEKGNLVKADRFGYVKRAMHGTRMLSTQDVRCALNFTPLHFDY